MEVKEVKEVKSMDYGDAGNPIHFDGDSVSCVCMCDPAACASIRVASLCDPAAGIRPHIFVTQIGGDGGVMKALSAVSTSFQPNFFIYLSVLIHRQ
jgi:hypothetical protein